MAVFELSSSAKRNFQTGLTTAEGANLFDIANTGAHDMTPSQLATTAKVTEGLTSYRKGIRPQANKTEENGSLEAVGKGGR